MNLLRGTFILLGLLILWGCSPPKGVYHTVQSGQTLYQISKTYQVDESYLARVNRISDPTRMAVGQRVFIPGADRVHFVKATLDQGSSKSPVKSSSKSHQTRPPAKTATRTKPKAKPVGQYPAKPVVKTTKPKTTVVSKKPTATKEPAGRKKGKFLWPARGKVVKRFGGKGKNASNGIEIAVRRGSAVNSAAAGKVIYSGNGISGYGNLVILQHDDSYYSVYGFNSRNLVSSGVFVSKGQKIALSGTPPAGGTPRLYFEVRYRKHPVNPIFYLP